MNFVSKLMTLVANIMDFALNNDELCVENDELCVIIGECCFALKLGDGSMSIYEFIAIIWAKKLEMVRVLR